jgi:hypothetical protein
MNYLIRGVAPIVGPGTMALPLFWHKKKKEKGESYLFIIDSDDGLLFERT